AFLKGGRDLNEETDMDSRLSLILFIFFRMPLRGSDTSERTMYIRGLATTILSLDIRLFFAPRARHRIGVARVWSYGVRERGEVSAGLGVRERGVKFNGGGRRLGGSGLQWLGLVSGGGEIEQIR
ncbi:hypothetical protein HAX54_021504, partial [Datura stramonium]|nr:hypothetical protein [Datura stramonium]